ncbi:MAG: universal stress protein, partial [Pirellulaceae bacterium]|nr:universal stress protein [Pirellulaceae bacterium]
MTDHPIEFAPYGVLYPTDFSNEGSNAFAHALKIALQHRGNLTMLHVDPHHVEDHRWEKFPHVRQTLANWGMLADDAPHSAVAKELGLGIDKIGAEGSIVGSILDYADHHPIRLI